MTRRRRAVVFGPVQPVFDPAFLDPITDWLTDNGYAVEILDSLTVIDDPAMTLADVASEWVRRRPDLEAADLLCGNAFGGALVQVVAPVVNPGVAVLALSAPTVADRVLGTRLAEVARHARMGNLAGALWTLDDLVRSESMPSPARVATPTTGDHLQACRRIDLGMSLLTDLDVSASITSHTGPVLSIVGARSRLVTADHVRLPTHGVVAEIPDAGMRPHRDNAAAVVDLLTEQRTFLAGRTDRAGARHHRTHHIDTQGAA